MRGSTPGYGLPKRHRLRASRDYRRVQGRGRRLRQDHLLALALPGRGPESRVGITVSRKVGNAVVRNRVKRWLREAIRHERAQLDPRAGAPPDADRPGAWDVVLIAHPRAATAGAEALRADVREVFRRIRRSRAR